MKIYTELGENLTIKNLSTFKTEACTFEVTPTEPIDFSKIEGYKVTYDYETGKNNLAFDAQTYKEYQEKQAEQEALSLATKLMDELSYKTILDNAAETQALIMKPLYPQWEVNRGYKKGEYVNFENILYKVLQDHTSQSDWTPDKAVSLYVNVVDPQDSYPPFKKPTGAHDAYSKGDGITFEEKHYRSKIDGNVYSPAESPDSWELVE